jgi:PiT family inorganic phosphate transporter
MEIIRVIPVVAICWNLLTWWLGIPSSSSHTLIEVSWELQLLMRLLFWWFSGYLLEDGLLLTGTIVSWYKAGKDGGVPSGVLYYYSFSISNFSGALMSYLFSICF